MSVLRLKNLLWEFIVLSSLSLSACCETHEKQLAESRKDSLCKYENHGIDTSRQQSEIAWNQVATDGSEVNGHQKKEDITIVETQDIIIYYPYYERINLVTGTMPNKVLDSNVIFCCEAAYTRDRLKEFKHNNIAGDHVSSGVRYNGYPCTRNTGAFVWYKGKWKFLYQNYSYELDSAAMNGGMGYGQEMLIHEDTIRATERRDNNVNVFRALCEVDGKLCIIDSKTRVAFGEFKRMCLEHGAKEAIYLDMGDGWNHSWYRNDEGEVIEIYPKTKDSRYCTNWLTFYR